jgi:hypothetical protein
MPRFLIGAMPYIVFVSFMQFRGVTWDWVMFAQMSVRTANPNLEFCPLTVLEVGCRHTW